MSQSRSIPPSPLALAEAHSRGRYTAEPAHLRLLDQALVYLDARQAPVRFLRRLRPTRPIPENVPDDEEMPFRRLMIWMPPRHAKSVTVSQYFAAWYLGKHPDQHVILTSYQDNFARSWGRKARDVLKELGPALFGVDVKTDTKAADEWELTAGGGMLTAGVGGAITGRGGNALICDDPVKNADEAASETIQQRNLDWWQSTAYTRLEPDGIAIVIQTRWDERDLSGSILADEETLDDEEVWYVLNLPAIAEEHDTLGRQPGEALWPQRYPLTRLEEIRRRIGSYFFSALFMQRPTPLEGGLFKRSAWQWYDVAPEGYNPGYIFVDTAGYKDSKTADYASFASIVRVHRDLFWLNAGHGRWTFPQLIQRLKDEHGRTGLPICVENVPWARPVIQTLESEIPGAVVPFDIKGVAKEARAQASTPYHEAGRFYLPRRGHWTGELVDEHAAFPNGAHDDFVDLTSMGAMKLLGATIIPQKAAMDYSGKRPAPASNKGWSRVR